MSIDKATILRITKNLSLVKNNNYWRMNLTLDDAVDYVIAFADNGYTVELRRDPSDTSFLKGLRYKIHAYSNIEGVTQNA